MKRFLVNGFILTLTAIFMRSITMVFNVYVSNKIGTEAVGLFGLIISVYSFFVTIATSGLSLACTYLVSKYFAKKQYFAGLKVAKICNIFGFLLGLISSILLILLANMISTNWFDNKISPIPFYLISFSLPCIGISCVINGYFSAVGEAYKSAISQCLELLVKIIISFILLRYYPINNVETVCIYLILADIISQIFSSVFLFVLYKINTKKYFKRKFDSKSFKKAIFKISVPVAITSYIRSFLSTLKQFIVPKGLVAFGLSYTLAISEYGKITGMALPIIFFPMVLIGSFGNLIIPEFSRLNAKGYKKRIVTVSHKIFFIGGLFSIIITIFFIIFANELSLRIFQSIECAIYIKMISPLIFFMYIDNIIDNMLKGLNKQFQVMLCNIVDLVVSILILCFALPRFGIKGYVFCAYVSEILNFVISYITLANLIYH